MKLMCDVSVSPRVLFAVSAILLSSCLHQNDIRQESIYKGEILNYLNQLNTASIGSRTVIKSSIPELVNAIDFTNVGVYKLRTTEKAIIADLKPMESFGKASKIKALFYLNSNKIVRSRIIAFDDKVKPNDYDGTLLSILNHDDSKGYSGKVSFYSPFQHLMLFSVFENGNLTISGVAHNKKLTQLDGRATDVCTDWYLVTTYYYTDGTIRTTQEYLYSTCDEGGDTGGGGGSSGFAFPSSPSNNDIYEFTDWEGKCTTYKFDSQTGYWVIVQVILPGAVVQSQRDNYPFLPEYPYNRQTVLAPDGIIYKYDGGSGDWVGELLLINRPPLAGEITDINAYLKCFNINSGGKITIYVDQPTPNSRATWSGSLLDPDVGHTFISIQQDSITRMIGFYPKDGVNPCTSSTDQSSLWDDGNHSYDVKVEINVNASQLAGVINQIKQRALTYDLDNYNCTDFGMTISRTAGFVLPDTRGTWTCGGGSNPGDLGEDVRKLSSTQNVIISKTAGTAQANSGTCN